MTGVIGVSADPTDAPKTGIYTLDGRRINGQPTQKGVYISNGKKVMMQ